MKILVVEDEMIIADNICMILEDIGYEAVEPAINYPEAIETIEAENPDLIILDIQLAGKLDGVDLAQTINKDYKIPFIFLTSNSDSQTLERVKKVNPHAFLVKPFKKEDLYSSIELSMHSYMQNQQNKAGQEDVSLIKDAIFVKDKNLFHKIKLESIRFLKSEHVYVEVYTVDDKKYLIRGSLSRLSDRLPANFYQTHRSFTINLDHMDAINSAYVIIGDDRVPIGKNYREELLSRIRIE